MRDLAVSKSQEMTPIDGDQDTVKHGSGLGLNTKTES